MNEYKIDQSCVPHPRKGWYWLISIPYVALLTITAVFLFKFNTAIAITYIGLYLISIILHGYICSFSECPYKNTFCPGAFGWFPTGKIAGLFFKMKIKKSTALVNLFFMIIILSTLGIMVLPTFWIGNLGVLWLIGYVLFILIHFFIFVLVMCPKCAGRSFCPTARLSKVLNKAMFNVEIKLEDN